jgi:hypothetical protein
MLDAKNMMVTSRLLLTSAFSLQHSTSPPLLPDVLKVRPISDHGNVNEIIGKFGGADQLRNAGGEFKTEQTLVSWQSLN